MLEIYLTDLQSYNEGDLVGKWMTLPMTDQELSQAISEVLCEGEAISGSENHEEYFITDWAWSNHEFQDLDEYENIYELNFMLQLLQDKSDTQLKAISFLVKEGLAIDIEIAIDKADDVIIHEDQTMEDVAYYLIQDCYNVHELSPLIANHIDYEGIARDLEMDGTYFEMGSDVYEYVG